MKPNTLIKLLSAVFICVSAQVSAQDMQTLQKMDPKEVAKLFEKNPPLFLKVATKTAKWNDTAEPVKIAGPIYFVGTKGLSVWLIKSSAGLILLNTAMPGSGPMTEASIRKLGFKPEDIKLLLTCHAHIDHVGAHAYFVVFPDGSGVNPGFRVARNPSYPGIGDDYRRTFQILEALKPDIWLTPHTDVLDFDGKQARAAQKGIKAWVDPDGYAKYIADQRAKFEAVVKAELEAPAK